jgi:nucleoid-associated protein YgaU
MLPALVALAALIVAPPVALWHFVAWPLPRTLPHLDTLGRPVGDDVLINAVALVCWLAWLQLVACLAAELVGYARGRSATRLPASAGLQRLASWMVTSLLVVGSSPLLRAAGTPLPDAALAAVRREPAAATATAGDHVVRASATASLPTYTVARRDTLWGIAARHLRDPLRWPEILELNRDRPQGDGATLNDPRQLRTGWVLALPSDASGLQAAGAAPAAAVTVATGDTLSGITKERLGDARRWAEVFDLNRARPQPDGTSLRNPDLIRPGWILNLPVSAPPVQAPRTAAATDAASPPQQEAPAPPPAATPPESPSPAAPGDRGHQSPEPPATTSRSEPRRAVPVGLLGSGLAAAGVVIALDRLRRSRQRHRLPGRRPAALPTRLADAEQSLRGSAEEQRGDVDRVDVALRSLGTGLAKRNRPVPSFLAVQLNDQGIELLLANPTPDPPEGFVAQDDGWLWTMATEAIDRSTDTDGLAPLPALVTVGTGEAGTILIDIETAGSIELTGPEATELLTSFAIELATSTWADHLDIVLIGDDIPGLDELDRVRTVASVGDVIKDLEASAATIATALGGADLPSTIAARTAPNASETWSPTIVLCSESPGGPDVARLTTLAGNGGRGIAIVTAGPMPGAHWTFVCEDGAVAMTPLGLRVRTAAPGEQETDLVEALFEEPEEIEIVLDDVADEAAEDTASDRDDARPQPESPGVEIDDTPPESIASPPAPMHELFQPGTCKVEVRVLGAVEIVGSNQPLDGGKPAEIVAYLATHPGGIDGDRLRTALWPATKIPAQKTFANTISNTRQRLGARHFPHATNDLYQLGPAVTTDLARLEAMVRYARRQDDATVIPILQAALELVRGLPFTTAHGFNWAQPEGLVAHAEALVVEAAHRMATLCMEHDDPASADWAARQGLLASPGNEALFRDRMAAANAAGNPAGVEAVMEELCEAIEAGNPFDTLHPETLAMYEKLSKRQRQASQH